ncbi:phage tail protein [Novosphingobium sp. ZN18A2]|uniref:phage tail protein n=1 Tax=Novosphingobium sp. ZN18A2 TaxID=3079861 RepID=UPI0030D1F3B2
MATLILSAVGTAIGGPVGGAIGALIGRQVDSAIIGAPHREGPRLKDLAVQTSSYGAPLPLHFGRMRAAGTVIWATELVEHSERQGGGKGRPSVTAYSYTASFAVALASRPIARIGRVWADGNLLRGEAGDLKAGGTMRVHTGHGDQRVDPLIVQAEGAANCPAFRHTAYAVFEDLELADFGNRLPSLTFEVFADDDDCTLARIVRAIAPQVDCENMDAAIAGFTIDSGRAVDTLSTLSNAFALAVALDGNRIAVSMAGASANTLPMLDMPVAGGAQADTVQQTGWSRQRSPLPEARQAGLRYYDPARDYQPGLQRSPGRAAPGDLAVIDLPAAMSAAKARTLAGTVARRAAYPADRIRYRVGTIDPAIRPGACVRLPVAAGTWQVDSWEWQAGGVMLDLRAVPGNAGSGKSIADPGRANLPLDEPVPPTVLDAFEVPWDGTGGGNAPSLFAAASAVSAAWRGAALFAQQSADSLVPLGSTGRQRAITGTALGALPASSPLLLDRSSRLVVRLSAVDLDLAPTDLAGLVRGGNRAMIGDEIVQFARCEPLGDGCFALSGLLRGRGGTEWAIGNHQSGDPFVLLDNALVPLDPAAVGEATVATILATGLGDGNPAQSAIRSAGATLRPLAPVHGKAAKAPDGSLHASWIRRARGAWGWPDYADLPLNETREIWDIAFGDPAAPLARWRTAEAVLDLSPETAQPLLGSEAPRRLTIRQIGSVSASHPLTIEIAA